MKSCSFLDYLWLDRESCNRAVELFWCILIPPLLERFFRAPLMKHGSIPVTENRPLGFHSRPHPPAVSHRPMPMPLITVHAHAPGPLNAPPRLLGTRIRSHQVPKDAFEKWERWGKWGKMGEMGGNGGKWGELGGNGGKWRINIVSR